MRARPERDHVKPVARVALRGPGTLLLRTRASGFLMRPPALLAPRHLQRAKQGIAAKEVERPSRFSLSNPWAIIPLLMAKYQAVRGTKDILPADAALFQLLGDDGARRFRSVSGFSEIRTPTFESLDLFQRSIGETTDVVQKEMYVFEDRGGRKLALRPEGTAGVVRAYHRTSFIPKCSILQAVLHRPHVPCRTPPGRPFPAREFWQIGGEYFQAIHRLTRMLSFC